MHRRQEALRVISQGKRGIRAPDAALLHGHQPGSARRHYGEFRHGEAAIQQNQSAG